MAGGGQRAPREVVHELSLDAAIRAEDGEARPLHGAGDLTADTAVAALASLADGESRHQRSPTEQIAFPGREKRVSPGRRERS
jgi:hypothetical protein